MSPRPLAGPRLARVLALVPWIATHPGTTIAELAARFEVDEAELERDLELLPMCGLPPYTADRLIDVWIADDGAVSIRLAEYFERPLRLSPAEGVALLASGRGLLAVPGADPDGPLSTALAKLESALGTRHAVDVDLSWSVHLGPLREAAAAGRQVELEYYSFARDEMTQRVVDPWRVFSAFGSWYLAAWCHQADAERLFRVDRVRSVALTGAEVEHLPPGDADESGTGGPGSDDAEPDVPATNEPGVYRPGAGDLRVRLLLHPSAEWVTTSYLTEEVVPGPDGSFEVVLPVSARALLERLLLGLGPAATVLDPPEARAWASEAAARVLDRYDRS